LGFWGYEFQIFMRAESVAFFTLILCDMK